MVLVYTLRNQVESSLIEAALKEAGIKFIIRDFTDSAYDGIFIAQKGYGQVLVEEADQKPAAEIIAAVLQESENH